MTDESRSVEIPDNIDEVLEVAHAAAVARWITGSSDTTQMLLSVDAALEAALPYLAPAGDGGLREAVEKLCDFVEEVYEGCTPSRGCTGCEALLKVQDARAALTAHPAAPAVPQPVDREAIEDAIRDELLPSLGLEIANPLSIDAANAVLAVLAGEQEQADG